MTSDYLDREHAKMRSEIIKAKARALEHGRELQRREEQARREAREREERERSETQANTQAPESRPQGRGEESPDSTDPFGEAAAGAAEVDDRIAGKPTSYGASPSHAGTVENTTSIRFEGADGVTGKTDTDVGERSAQSSTGRDSSSDTDTDHADRDLARKVDRDELSESVSLSGAAENSEPGHDEPDRHGQDYVV